jgi:hypothetical protein
MSTPTDKLPSGVRTGGVQVKLADGSERTLPIHGITQLQFIRLLDEVGVKSFDALKAAKPTLEMIRVITRAVALALTFEETQDIWNLERIEESFADMEQVQTTTETAWNDIQQATKSSLNEVQNQVSRTIGTEVPTITGEGMTETATITDTVLQTMRAAWEDAQTAIRAGTQDFFDWSISKFTEALTVLSNLWQSGWTQIMTTAANIWGQIMTGLTNWYALILNATATNLTVMGSQFQTALSTIYGVFTSTFSGMV